MVQGERLRIIESPTVEIPLEERTFDVLTMAEDMEAILPVLDETSRSAEQKAALYLRSLYTLIEQIKILKNETKTF